MQASILHGAGLFLAGWLAFGGTISAQPDAKSPPATRLDYSIVVTGEELLRGVYADAHGCFLTRTLHMLGAHCLGISIVDDRSEDIQEAVAAAAKKARLVIVTGGLGPTANDVTRGALAQFAGVRLEEHPEALSELERRFRKPRDQLLPTLRRQALVPISGSYLKNPNGTAVGLVFEKAGVVVVALPGPPRELQPMVRNELVPLLRQKFGVRSPGSSLTLRFVGLGQSQIDQVLRETVPMPPDLLVSSLFEGGRVDFTFALPGSGDEDRARLKKIEDLVRGRLGENIYSSNGSSLEDEVVKRIRDRGGSLVLVEVGSGGHLAASLDGVEGIASVLVAGFDAPTDERMRKLLRVTDPDWGALTNRADRARVLGGAASRLAESRWAIVVSEIETDAKGGSRAWLAFGAPDGPWALEQVPVQGAGETMHASLTTQVLDRIRRWLDRH